MAVYGEGWLANEVENCCHIVGCIFQLFVMNRISHPEWQKCLWLEIARCSREMGYASLNHVVRETIRLHLRNVWPIVGLKSLCLARVGCTSGSKRGSSFNLPTISSCSKSARKASFRQIYGKIHPATWSPIWEAGRPWPAWAQGPTGIFN